MVQHALSRWHRQSLCLGSLSHCVLEIATKAGHVVLGLQVTLRVDCTEFTHTRCLLLTVLMVMVPLRWLWLLDSLLLLWRW